MQRGPYAPSSATGSGSRFAPTTGSANKSKSKIRPANLLTEARRKLKADLLEENNALVQQVEKLKRQVARCGGQHLRLEPVDADSFGDAPTEADRGLDDLVGEISPIVESITAGLKPSPTVGPAPQPLVSSLRKFQPQPRRSPSSTASRVESVKAAARSRHVERSTKDRVDLLEDNYTLRKQMDGLKRLARLQKKEIQKLKLDNERFAAEIELERKKRKRQAYATDRANQEFGFEQNRNDTLQQSLEDISEQKSKVELQLQKAHMQIEELHDANQKERAEAAAKLEAVQKDLLWAKADIEQLRVSRNKQNEEHKRHVKSLQQETRQAVALSKIQDSQSAFLKLPSPRIFSSLPRSDNKVDRGLSSFSHRTTPLTTLGPSVARTGGSVVSEPTAKSQPQSSLDALIERIRNGRDDSRPSGSIATQIDHLAVTKSATSETSILEAATKAVKAASARLPKRSSLSFSSFAAPISTAAHDMRSTIHTPVQLSKIRANADAEVAVRPKPESGVPSTSRPSMS